MGRAFFITLVIALLVEALAIHVPVVEPPSSTTVCDSKRKVLWFMAVQSYSKSVESSYYNYVLAALNSARSLAPSLAPILIHTGAVTDIPQVVRNVPNLRIVDHNLTFFHEMTKSLGNHSMVGAWLRFDIPYIVRNLLTDLDPNQYDLDYALYTDTDVLFFNDFNECSIPKPPILAMGPESNRGSQGNSGVLYMNVTAMQEHWPSVLELAVRKNFKFASVDQGLFVEYFVFGNRSVLMPDRFNWKGYWGGADDVVIAHFHGPKPGRCLDCLLMYRDHYRAFCSCPSVYFSIFYKTPDHGTFYERMLYGFNNFTRHP